MILKKYSRIILITALIGVMVSGCNYFRNQEDQTTVARVYDTYLYLSELESAIPNGSTSEDSAIISRNYINTWVRKQLLLHQAENALSEEQKDFEKKLEEYRSSLLIYSYRQKLIQQKLDTSVTADDITAYYEENIDNFVLSEDVVKAIFVKIPLTAPEISNVRRWTRSGNIDDIDQLEKYSVNYADKFDVFNNSWIYFSELMKQIPLSIEQPGRFLRYNTNIETTDSAHHYFIKILDHKTAGEVTPMELMSDEIKSILLNKRKIQFYKELENQVYNEGLNKNAFEIY